MPRLLWSLRLASVLACLLGGAVSSARADQLPTVGGDIAAEGAFTCDLTMPATTLVDTPEP